MRDLLRVLSVLMGLNAFDQWGVELGKVIGKQIRATLESGEGLDELDSSSAALVEMWRKANGPRSLDSPN